MAPDLAPQFVVTGDPTARDIVEIFDDAVLDGLIDADGAYAVSGGTISKMTEASQIDRSYVGTLATGYNAVDFTGEVTFTLIGTDFTIHFFGIGVGAPVAPPYYEPIGIFLRIHDYAGSPHTDASATVNALGGGWSHIGNIGTINTDGPHRARIEKSGNLVMLSVDVGNDGTFDLVGPALDMTVVAPWLDNTNSQIFFGTATDKDWFDDLTITVQNPDSECDGVPDEDDNCSAIANADQADGDNDGMGDACDPDVDAPVIELSGDAEITIECGEGYTELGASATDDFDGAVDQTAPTVTAALVPLGARATSTTRASSQSSSRARTAVIRTQRRSGHERPGRGSAPEEREVRKEREIGQVRQVREEREVR